MGQIRKCIIQGGIQMLGKLIKYDLRYGIRIFILIHAILVISCTLGRFLFMNRLDFHSDPAGLVSSLIVFSSLFILLFVAVNFGLYALLIVRFYKNLFTDEGYLTWTLPASPTQQLWAKILSGTIWLVLDIPIVSLSLLILFTGKNVTTAYAHVAPGIDKVLGMSISTFGIYALVFTLLGAISSLILLYLCVGIGQLFPGHRILCSVITYCIISCIMQALAFALMFAFNISPANNAYISARGQDMAHYLFMAFNLGEGMCIFIAIVGYFALHQIMNKKINLN